VAAVSIKSRSAARRARFRPRSAPARFALLVAGVAALAGFLFQLSPLEGALEERLGAYLLFRLRGPLPPPPEVVVVTADRDSAEALGIAATQRRWPRRYHADLIERLAARGAAVIALDLLFRVPAEDPEDDTLFSAALARAGNVVLLQGLERNTANANGGAGLVEADVTSNPLPELAARAGGVAPFPLPRVPARVDRFWTFHGPDDVPTLPAVALQLAARDLAPSWIELLSDAGLPRSSVEDWAGPRLAAAMTGLRQAMAADPGLAARLRASLEKSAVPDRDRPRLSRLIDLYAGADSRLLDFRGPPGTIRTIRYADILGMPTLDLDGKVVFVGLSELRSSNQIDSYDTVFSGENGINLSGVEIAATAFADLAEGASPRRPGSGAAISILAVALLLGAAMAFGRVSVVLGGAVALAAATVLLDAFLFDTNGLLLPLAGPLMVQIPAGVLTGIWGLRALEARKRRRIEAAAGEFLPAEIVAGLGAGPIAASAPPAGETRATICLASDIEGFVSLAEGLSPDAVGDILNEYFSELFTPVRRAGGEISTVAGDGSMCVWSGHSAPLARERPAAIGAALDILDTVKRLNRLGHAPRPLRTRIGLHAGPALIGIVGGAGKYVPHVVGDVPNTASRLENLNKLLHSCLLASDTVTDGLSGFVLRPLGQFLLAGKSEALAVAEVLGRADDASAARIAESFAHAFEAYRGGDPNAASLFEKHLKEFPDDGPAVYFLRRCLASPGSVNQAESLVIRVGAKE
jgi:adenylate cyclase